MKATCKNCGEKFRRAHANRKFCSFECRDQAKAERERRRNEKHKVDAATARVDSQSQNSYPLSLSQTPGWVGESGSDDGAPSLLFFEGQRVRAIKDHQGMPWFVAADVCHILGLTNPSKALTALDMDEIDELTLSDTIGRQQRTKIISHPGAFRLTMRSRKPEARRFQRWVLHEVLPSIARTGSYGTRPTFGDFDPTNMEQLIPVASKLANCLMEANRQNLQLKGQVQEAQPKVDFYDDYAKARGGIGLRKAAKVFALHPNKWTRWLRESGYLYYEGNSQVPTVKYQKSGLFSTKTYSYEDQVLGQTLLTAKGMQHFGALVSQGQLPRDVYLKEPGLPMRQPVSALMTQGTSSVQ